MKTFKIALCLPIMALIPLSAHADPQQDPADQTSKIKKPHYKVAHRHYKVAEPRYEPAPVSYPVVAAAPAYAPHAYNWSGFFVGGYAGASNDDHNPQLTVPTYGALQGNDIGFAGSNLNNSYNVESQTYNALANGTNSNAGAAGNLNGPFASGYTYYTATASSYGYINNAGNGNANSGSVTNAGTTTTNNGSINNGYSSATVTPYNNLNGDRTDSQLTTTNSTHRLLGLLGGEVGYRRQYGMFVVGVEADGGYIDGRNTQTSNSTGQFSNSQGANTTATAGECTGTVGGNGGCTTSITNSSNGSVNVANNGNSSFSQSIQAGPQWLGTARLSTGVAVDRVLLYATGGFAYGEADMAVSANYRDTANSVCSGNAGSPTAGGVYAGGAGGTSVAYSCNGNTNTGSSFTYSNAAQWYGSNSRLLTGFAIGSGAAFAVTDNVIFKLEGYYYNLGSISTTAYGTGTQTLTVNSGGNPSGATPGTRAASVTPYSVSRKIDGFIAKIGVQVKFDTGSPAEPAPVIAKY